MDTGIPNSTESSEDQCLASSSGPSDTRNEGLVPQLLTSVPKLNEAASYLAETASLFTSCFPIQPSRDGQEMVTFASGEETERLLPSGSSSSYQSTSSIAESTSAAIDAPSVVIGTSRTHSGDLPLNTGTIVTNTQTSLIGIPIFRSIIDRVKKTVRGSADDIGWMQRASDMPPVEDGTERFIEILDDIRHGLHQFPNSLVYLLVPGLFSNHGPLYFVTTKTSFSKMGLTCHIAKIHSEASVEKNAKEIKAYIEELYWGSRKRVLLLGHSKGGIDAAAALSMYWDDLKDKVAGLALAQSPYGGSPIASDILREGQIGDYVNIRKLMEVLICQVIKGDMEALEDLTYEKRKDFLRKYHIPKELPVVSFHT